MEDQPQEENAFYYADYLQKKKNDWLKPEEREPEKSLANQEINCKILIIAQIMCVKFPWSSLGFKVMTLMFYSSKVQN